MTSKIIYPKPLPKLQNQNLPLETGFTATEIVALQNGWRLIKRCLNQHASKIFIDFFSENYYLLDKFRIEITNTFNLNSLHQHPYQLMTIYGNLIESGLKDGTFIKGLLSEVANRHKMFGVTYEEIKLLTDYITYYFINLLDKIKSPTFVNGFIKLSNFINEHHKDKTNEKEQPLEESS